MVKRFLFHSLLSQQFVGQAISIPGPNGHSQNQQDATLLNTSAQPVFTRTRGDCGSPYGLRCQNRRAGTGERAAGRVVAALLEELMTGRVSVAGVAVHE